MKNNEGLIKVINHTPVISSKTLASLVEIGEKEMKMRLSDSEEQLKCFGSLLVDKTRGDFGSFETYLNERQTYYFINELKDISKINYLMRRLLDDFSYVSDKLLKKKNQKLLKRHLKAIAELEGKI